MGESISEYVAELKRLANNCQFGQYLDEALRDRLVCGMRSQSTQKRLLAEADLTFSKALAVALSVEAAEKNTQQLNGCESLAQTVSYQSAYMRSQVKGRGNPRKPPAVNSGNPQGKQQCYRCGSPKHKANTCKFKDTVCHSCHKLGHLAKVCRSKRSSSSQAAQNRLAEEILVEEPGETELLPLFRLGKKGTSPIVIDVNINGKMVTMEVDTGAARSVMSEVLAKQLFPNLPMKKTSVVLHTYSAEALQVCGELPTKVAYGNQVKELSLLIIQGNGPTLLGRDWLAHLRLDWEQITSNINVVRKEASGKLPILLKQHQEVFKEGLGTVSQLKASLSLREDVQPMQVLSS